MKLIKMLGLAAVTALAAMAFIGASSASADVVCLVEPTGTEGGSCPLPNGDTSLTLVGLTTTANPAILLGENTKGEVTVEETCHSTAEGKLEKTAGDHKGIEGKITSLTFTGCKGLCSAAKSINIPYKAVGSGLTQTLTATTGGTGNPGAILENCIFAGNCEYSAATATLKVVGGNPAKLVASKIALAAGKGNSFLCPAKGAWDATYEIISPKVGLWLAALLP